MKTRSDKQVTDMGIINMTDKEERKLNVIGSIVMVFVAILMTFVAISWTLQNGVRTLCSITFLGTLKLDLFNLMAGSMSIITIFAWKQTVYLIFKAPKSTLIKRSVKILWI